ncbi:unnamed protein product [Clonostachys rosea]|uniref:Uncharacterized protein n=1 Tax=Bionectria ochroleuca TaxID=29856 RepID=A0ABY6V1R0_BIOOC|nr:unnamed protein product [Clonostachys rosea]
MFGWLGKWGPIAAWMRQKVKLSEDIAGSQAVVVTSDTIHYMPAVKGIFFIAYNTVDGRFPSPPMYWY